MTGAEQPLTGRHVAVIGAGVVGLSIAAEAVLRGARVTLYDRDPVARGTSSGNAGGLAFCEIEPLAAPGTLRRAPLWALQPTGPLSLPPAQLPRMAPWLLRFAAACRPAAARRGTAAQAALMAEAQRRAPAFLQAVGAQDLLRRHGHLDLYATRRAYAEGLATWAARAPFGYRGEALEGAGALAERQPGLSPDLRFGIWSEDWWAIADPADYLRALERFLRARGAVFRQVEVRGLAPSAAGVEVATAEGAEAADRAVLAAGAWSHRLARPLGDRLPLETERGYNTTLPAGAFDLRCHVSFREHGFVAAPLSSGVRIGGAVELAGLDRPPNWRRARAMLDRARRLLPGLRTEGGREWMGFRPSFPDSLPVLSPAPADPRIVYAFGHGHLGLTQSFATSAIACDLLAGAAPAVDLAPFSPRRFGRG